MNPKLRLVTATLSATFVLVTVSACGSGTDSTATGTDKVAVGDAPLPEDIAAAEAGLPVPGTGTAEEIAAQEGRYSLPGSADVSAASR